MKRSGLTTARSYVTNMASTSGSSITSSNINWDLCCLCQQEVNEQLQKPKEEGRLSLERDLKGFLDVANVLPTSVNVTIDQLNNGSGMPETLKTHNAKYHKHCRSYCSSSCVKRVRHDDDAPPLVSPKKLRSCQPKAGGTPIHCMICDGENTDDLHKAVTDNVDSNLKSWAETSKTLSSLEDSLDVYYHTKCYVRLRDTARLQSQDTSRVSEGEASSFQCVWDDV